jgi:hypothetical protein
MMERSYHGTSHLGRMSVDHLLGPTQPRTDVTVSDLDNLAKLIYVKLQVAIFHNNEIQIKERERQLSLIAETADLIA